MLLLTTCVVAILSGISIVALDLTPSFGHLKLSSEGGQVVEWDGYTESAGVNLAAFELTLKRIAFSSPATSIPTPWVTLWKLRH